MSSLVLDTTTPPTDSTPVPPPHLYTPPLGSVPNDPYKPPRYLEAYHLTQLGMALSIPPHLLALDDPDSGFGLKPGGPQV
jgi:hypothetical protein